MVDLGRVLNLLQADPQAMVASLRQKAADLDITPEEIQQLIDERTQARNNKDWARADAIRKATRWTWIYSWKIRPGDDLEGEGARFLRKFRATDGVFVAGPLALP